MTLRWWVSLRHPQQVKSLNLKEKFILKQILLLLINCWVYLVCNLPSCGYVFHSRNCFKCIRSLKVFLAPTFWTGHRNTFQLQDICSAWSTLALLLSAGWRTSAVNDFTWNSKTVRHSVSGRAVIAFLHRHNAPESSTASEICLKNRMKINDSMDTWNVCTCHTLRYDGVHGVHTGNALQTFSSICLCCCNFSPNICNFCLKYRQSYPLDHVSVQHVKDMKEHMNTATSSGSPANVMLSKCFLWWCKQLAATDNIFYLDLDLMMICWQPFIQNTVNASSSDVS